MATTTTRLGLRKPAGSDSVTVATDLDNNYDTIDTVIGTVWATTSTRPSTPFQGQPVTESDNGSSGSLVIVHNGSSPASGGWIYPRGSAVDCTSSTHPTKGPVGLLARESDTGKLLVANASNPASGSFDAVTTSASVGAVLLARVASDVTVNASTTLTNGTGLVVALLANAAYALDGWISYTSGTTPNFKMGWTGPAAYGGSWASHGPPTSAASRIGSIDTGVAAITSALATSGDASTGPSAKITGYVTTAGTAGNLQFQFAQNTSNASNTILKTGSWIRLTRVA